MLAKILQNKWSRSFEIKVHVYRSSGVTSGIDLVLSLVEEDFGLDIALRIARALVLFLRRPAGQNQFSMALALQGSSRVQLREFPVYILEHPQDPLTVENLAAVSL